jgi:hypothetical protein
MPQIIEWEGEGGRYQWVPRDQVRYERSIGDDVVTACLYLLANGTWVLQELDWYEVYDRDAGCGTGEWDCRVKGRQVSPGDAIRWLREHRFLPWDEDWPEELRQAAAACNPLASPQGADQTAPAAPQGGEASGGRGQRDGGQGDAAGRRPPRKRGTPKDEANVLVRRHLQANPSATIREVSAATGVSVGAVHDNSPTETPTRGEPRLVHTPRS